MEVDLSESVNRELGKLKLNLRRVREAMEKAIEVLESDDLQGEPQHMADLHVAMADTVLVLYQKFRALHGLETETNVMKKEKVSENLPHMAVGLLNEQNCDASD
eukprot:jgi/Botrbrau1/11657/Bobra.168_2s0014.1